MASDGVSSGPDERPQGSFEEAGVLDRVMRRMSGSGGFPALAQSVTEIVQALDACAQDDAALTRAILSDLSLTQKVLKLANSAMYAPIGRNVSTVSHALTILGYEAVGHLALGARMISSLGRMEPGNPTAEQELAHSLLAGSIASTVVGRLQLRGGEEGVVCALLHRTGRLLTAFFLDDEWSRIRAGARDGRAEDEVVREVLGLSFEDLGMQVAEQWRLPAKIVATMQPQPAGEDDPEAEAGDWLLGVTRFANQAAGVLSASHDEESQGRQLETLAIRYGACLGAERTDLMAAVAQATDTASAQPILAGVLLDRPKARPPAPAPDTRSGLQTGLEEVRQALAEGGSPVEILNMVLEVMYASLELSRTAVFLRAPGENLYRVRASLTVREPNRLVGLSFPGEPATDVVTLALDKGADIYIHNPRDTKIAHRLPGWLLGHGPHPFFLLPMRLENGQPFGLIFGQQQDDRLLTKQGLGILAKLRDLLEQRARGPRVVH
jgi:HD-like signal output (HDOD) protein